MLWAPSSLAADIFVALTERRVDSASARSRGRAAGLAALDARRVALGVGRFGVDFGEDTIANETGLVEQAIDFKKGCYLGQEIVARIFYKGKPSMPVLPLAVSGRAGAPSPPLEIRRVGADGTGGSGETAGRLTSVAAADTEGTWLAIGTVSRRALDDGAKLALEGGGEVRLRETAG